MQVWMLVLSDVQQCGEEYKRMDEVITMHLLDADETRGA